MSARPIIVDYDPKPIPIRRFDYVAARAGSDPECCHVGYGATEDEAIADLIAEEGAAQDEAEARAARKAGAA
jgi:hypothetical protein